MNLNMMMAEKQAETGHSTLRRVSLLSRGCSSVAHTQGMKSENGQKERVSRVSNLAKNYYDRSSIVLQSYLQVSGRDSIFMEGIDEREEEYDSSVRDDFSKVGDFSTSLSKTSSSRPSEVKKYNFSSLYSPS